MQRLFSSESVTEGHPDKLCDQVSDAIVDAFLAADPNSRVAVETVATDGILHLVGEVRSDATVDYENIARGVVRDIGYTDEAFGFNADTCQVQVSVGRQSAEIASGVDTALEVRNTADSDILDSLGAGDQGIMFGYATNETPTLMPTPIFLAHGLAQQLARVRHSGEVEFFRPDGKTQVTIGYEDSKPVRLDTIVVSCQVDPGVSRSQLESAVRDSVITPVIQNTSLDTSAVKLLINPSGAFTVGGPKSDAGLTGRKIIIDTYGGTARHGGGAFSGKDPTKVDRSAAYALRYAAKSLVAAGFADRLEMQLAYAIGSAHPVGLYVDSFGTSAISDDDIASIAAANFDFRPAAILRRLDLLRPIYRQTASYGHFGRTDVDLPWEHTAVIDRG